MTRSDGVATFDSHSSFLSVPTLSLDVGIIICCLIAIACKMKVYAYELSCAYKCSHPREWDCGDVCLANGRLPLSATSPKHIARPSMGVGGVGPCGGDAVSDAANARIGCVGELTTSAGCSGGYIADTAEANMAHGVCVNIIHVHVLGVPMRVSAVIGIANYLSLVSNCLTCYFRPSQVLYAFLMSFCDIMFYVIEERRARDIIRFKRAMCQNTAAGGFDAYPSDGASKNYGMWKDSAALEPRVVTTNDSYSSTVSRTYANHCKTAANICSDVHIGINDKMLGASGDKATKWRLRLPRFATWVAGCSPRLRLLHHWGLPDPYERWCFLPLLHIFSVLALLVMERYQMFFPLGAAGGYTASCITLYVLGYGVSALLLARSSFRAGGLFRFPSLLSAEACTEVLVGFFSLPTAPRESWVFLCFALQQLFSASCTVLYVMMLLEGSEAFYSTHVDLMRWYVTPCGQILMDFLRICAFWLLVTPGNGDRHKQGGTPRNQPDYNSHLL
uniref:Uncharacterized protein n=1 Tax=Trypanosoma congolense (strain IL3000) TaxID=1068625 RepID=G0UVZ7_TRYCI|nr:conserved hypothetical protein [Trypanosoma congolense IL3000]